MQMNLKCRCGKKYKIDAAAAGKRMKCPNCKATFVVPKPAGKDESKPTPQAQPADDFGLDDLAAFERSAAPGPSMSGLGPAGAPMGGSPPQPAPQGWPDPPGAGSPTNQPNKGFPLRLVLLIGGGVSLVGVLGIGAFIAFAFFSSGADPPRPAPGPVAVNDGGQSPPGDVPAEGDEDDSVQTGESDETGDDGGSDAPVRDSAEIDSEAEDVNETNQTPEINFENFDELLAAAPDVPLEDIEFTLQGVTYIVGMPIGATIGMAEEERVTFNIPSNEKVEVHRGAYLMPEFLETLDDYGGRHFPYVDDDTLFMAKADVPLTADARALSVYRHVRVGYDDLVFASPKWYLPGDNTLEQCLQMCKYCQTLRVKDPLPTDSRALLTRVGVVPSRARRTDGRLAMSVKGTSASFPLIAEHLPDVEVLYLGDTQDMRASDYEHLAKCPNLTELHVAYVHGQSLRAISKLTGLRRLRIALTEIKEDDFAHLAQMSNLESLDVNLKDCEDAGLKHLAEMPALQELVVDTFYGDSIDEALLAMRELTGLEKLTFRTKLLNDEHLVYFSGLTNLKSLELKSVMLKDEGWKHLAKLSSLEHLFVTGGDTFTGGKKVEHVNSVAGVQQLAKLPNLSELEFQHGSFEEGALAELAAAPRFESLSLISVELTDEDLEALAGLKSLKHLYCIATAEEHARVHGFFEERRPDVQLGRR